MIINKDTEKNAEVLTEGMVESHNMTIDTSSEGVLQMILSEGLYTDPMGSTVREWASNALDATREAGNDEPIIVSLTYKNGNYLFSVQDFGVGISPDRVDKVLSKYAASTKRGDANQLGFFGLGLKSGLSYADSFNIETIYDGTKYQYVMYKGEENTKLDLVNSSPTTERNGTTMSIVVKSSDEWNFKGKIKEQLAYFSGVHFNVSGVDNNFNILESEDWKYSEMATDGNMHIALDNVYYPIDFNRLKIKPIGLGVALNFKVSDGLMPIPSRENIKLTPAVKDLILAKIKKVCEYFVDKYNESVAEVDDVLTVLGKVGEHRTVDVGGKTFYIKDAAEFLKVKPKNVSVKGAPLVDIKQISQYTQFFLSDYWYSGEISGGTYRSIQPYSTDSIINNLLRVPSNVTVIRADQKPNRLMMDYIKDKYNRVMFVQYHPSRSITLGKPTKKTYWYAENGGYYQILNLKEVPKSKWRETITQFQMLLQQIKDKIILVDSIVPDDQWLAARKAARTRSAALLAGKEEVKFRFAEDAQRGDVYAVYPDQKIFRINELYKRKTFVIYSTIEDKKRLTDLYIMKKAINKNLVQIAIMSNRDATKLTKAKIHNHISMEDFLKGENKVFGTFCSMLKLKKITATYLLEDYSGTIVSLFDREFANVIVEVEKLNKGLYKLGDIEDATLVEEMLSLCEANKLWDPKIEELTNAYVEKAKAFSFFKHMKFKPDYGYGGPKIQSEDQKKFIIEVLKFKKVKMNPECYDTIPVAPVVAEEPVIEDVVEEAPIIEEEEDFVPDIQPLDDKDAEILNTMIANDLQEQELVEEQTF